MASCLFWTRTATLGAIISLIAMVQVFILNMTFDIPVKILSLHLVVLSLILLAPHVRNLLELFVFGQAAKPLTPTALFRRAGFNRWAAGLQVVLGVWVAIGAAQISWTGYQEYGAGGHRNRNCTASGRSRTSAWTELCFPPLTTDEKRWQRIVFDTGGATTLQMMDGALVPVPADIADETLQMQQPLASLVIERPRRRHPGAVRRARRNSDLDRRAPYGPRRVDATESWVQLGAGGAVLPVRFTFRASTTTRTAARWR